MAIAPILAGTPTYAESNGTATTSLTVAVPSGVQNGDILVAALRCGSSAQSTDYSSSGWTRRAYTFVGSSATQRVTGAYTHYVSTASSEPSSYTFTLTGNSFARQAGMMFIVRPGSGGAAWGSEPSYAVSPSFAGSNPVYPAAFTVTANSLIIHVGANETTSPSTTTWTAPAGTTSIGVRGSLSNQSDTSVTRSVVAAASEAVTGTTAGDTPYTAAWPSYSSPVAIAFSIPGTELAATLNGYRFSSFRSSTMQLARPR